MASKLRKCIAKIITSDGAETVFEYLSYYPIGTHHNCEDLSWRYYNTTGKNCYEDEAIIGVHIGYALQ